MSQKKDVVAVITDFDFAKMHFSPMTKENGRWSVDLFKEPGSRYRPTFCLCDSDDPISAKFKLDSVREDGRADRRGQMVHEFAPDALLALENLDKIVIQAAVRNAKDWFGKTLTEDQVQARYRPLVNEDKLVKFKVKCADAKVPTKLHLRDVDGVVHPNRANIGHLEEFGAKLVPIVSTPSLWFMGSGAQFGVVMQAEDMIVTPGESVSEVDKFPSKRGLKVAKETDEPYEGPPYEPPSKAVKVALTEEDDE